MHPDWADYLRRNLVVVQGWLDWHWAAYLSARNPNVPNVVRKLHAERKPFGWQRDYWDSVLRVARIDCPFSGTRLSPGNYDLDHFIPWAFVAHDEMWNLCPVAVAVNSLKSDQVPDLDLYLERFAEIQHQGLVFCRRHGSLRLYDRAADEFSVGLRMTLDQLKDKLQLATAYEQTIRPLAGLASRMGFRRGWVWQQPVAA
jgi:hypothetical protein